MPGSTCVLKSPPLPSTMGYGWEGFTAGGDICFPSQTRRGNARTRGSHCILSAPPCPSA